MHEWIVPRFSGGRRRIWPAPQPMGGCFSVDETASRLTSYRYAEVRMMEAQAGWLYTLPWFEVKATLGLFLYEDLHHADDLGRRVGELRARPHEHRPPSDQFALFCNELTNTTDPIERLVGLFRVLKPHMVAAYQTHLEMMDPLADAVTYQVLTKALAEETAHVTWGQAALEDCVRTVADREKALAWERHLSDVLAWSGGVINGEAIWEGEAPAIRDGGPVRRFDHRWPIRDERFPVVHFDDWTMDPALVPLNTKEALLARLHIILNGECSAMETIGRSLVDFPDLPWDMKVDLGRQLWDEARHIEMATKRFFELGGRIGMTQVDMWTYEHATYPEDILERLVALNLLVEGFVLDTFNTFRQKALSLGDTVTADMVDYILADETVHTGIGNKWIRRLTNEDPGQLARLSAYHKGLEENYVAFQSRRWGKSAVEN